MFRFLKLNIYGGELKEDFFELPNILLQLGDFLAKISQYV